MPPKTLFVMSLAMYTSTNSILICSRHSFDLYWPQGNQIMGRHILAGIFVGENFAKILPVTSFSANVKI
jgi:hypothetical protein